MWRSAGQRSPDNHSIHCGKPSRGECGQVNSEKAATEARGLQTRLEGQIKKLQDKVNSAETTVQQLTAKGAELQQALVQKAASMSDALREMQGEHSEAMAAAEQSFADMSSAKDQAHSCSIAALQVMIVSHT